MHLRFSESVAAQPRGSKIIGTGYRVRTMLRKPANIAASSPATVQFTIFGIHYRQAKNLNVLKSWPTSTATNGATVQITRWPGFHWIGLLISVMFDTCFHLFG